MNKKPDTFEKCLEKLEALVRELEAGDKGLEKSLELFEEGVGLSRDLTERLETAKTKVESLAKDAGGKLVRKPFDQKSV